MLGITGQAFAAPQKSVKVEASTIKNLDYAGTKLNNINSNEKVSFSNVLITKDQVELTGIVGNNGKSFKLIGQIKKSENGNKSLLVGSLNDSFNNYDVIFFGIDAAADTSLTLNKNKFKSGEVVLKLYLLEKGTRNLTVIETTNLNSHYNASFLLTNQNSLSIVDHEDQFWYAKLLQATEVPRFTPNTITSGNSDKYYDVSYTIIGGTIYEEMAIRHYIEGPTTLDASGGLFTTKMYVLSQKTWSYDFTGMDSSSTNFKAGYFTDTRVDAWTEPGDVLRQMQWDGS